MRIPGFVGKWSGAVRVPLEWRGELLERWHSGRLGPGVLDTTREIATIGAGETAELAWEYFTRRLTSAYCGLRGRSASAAPPRVRGLPVVTVEDSRTRTRRMHTVRLWRCRTCNQSAPCVPVRLTEGAGLRVRLVRELSGAFCVEDGVHRPELHDHGAQRAAARRDHRGRRLPMERQPHRAPHPHRQAHLPRLSHIVVSGFSGDIGDRCSWASMRASPMASRLPTTRSLGLGQWC